MAASIKLRTPEQKPDGPCVAGQRQRQCPNVDHASQDKLNTRRKPQAGTFLKRFVDTCTASIVR
jgi:hypothetical protein